MYLPGPWDEILGIDWDAAREAYLCKLGKWLCLLLAVRFLEAREPDPDAALQRAYELLHRGWHT